MKAFLIIDPNNDFVNAKGTMYIPQAEQGIQAICDYIAQNDPDAIIVSQDSHMSYHIGHCGYWTGHAQPFTTVSIEDIVSGKTTPKYVSKDRAIDYLNMLEEKGSSHTLWPDHCLVGSWGWAFPDNLVEAIHRWDMRHDERRPFEVYQKGTFANAEMFSIFSYANATQPDQRGKQIMNMLSTYDEIVIAGFAKDYCVAESVKDLRKDDRFEGKLRFFNAGMYAINDRSSNFLIYDDCLAYFGAENI